MTPEHTISQSQLALAIVSKCVKLACFRYQGSGQVATFNLAHRVRCFEIQALRSEETWRCIWVLAALTLSVPTPSEDRAVLHQHYGVMRSARQFLSQLASLQHTRNEQRRSRLVQTSIVDAKLAIRVAAK